MARPTTSFTPICMLGLRGRLVVVAERGASHVVDIVELGAQHADISDLIEPQIR